MARTYAALLERSPSGVNTSGLRSSMDSLLQAALVELFAAYGVAVAPLPRSVAAHLSAIPEVSIAVDLKRQTRREDAGRLTLSVPRALLEQMKPNETASIQLDWARELANQLSGRLRNRLLSFDVRFEVGMPTPIGANVIEQRLQVGTGLRAYAGRTRHGQLLVTLHGMPDDSELTYIGPPNVDEGSLIFF